MLDVTSQCAHICGSRNITALNLKFCSSAVLQSYHWPAEHFANDEVAHHLTAELDSRYDSNAASMCFEIT